MPVKVRVKEYGSPLGKLLLADAGGGLCGIVFPDARGNADYTGLEKLLGKRFGDFLLVQKDTSCLAGAVSYLRGFFLAPRAAGRYPGRLDPGGTAFQRAVWEKLQEIPAGKSATYGEIARKTGRPAAARAVGSACAANPLPIVVPCHRVIGADGSLTGFGGGLDLKIRLLRLEGWSG